MAAPRESTSNEANEGELHLLVRLGERLVGVPARLVAEMLRLGAVRPFPQASGVVRGSMLVRDEIVAVRDLRASLGLPTLGAEMEELRAMLRAREQDHRNWLEELERSVEEARPFSLATDPHKCAFGRWYDQFRTNNVVLAAHLKRFDGPHKRIHALAGEVDALVQAKQMDRARARIQWGRETELSEMIRLFRELDELLVANSQEIAVVLSGVRGARVAYAVDRVESLQPLTPQTPPAGSGSTRSNCALFGPNRELAVLLSDADLLTPDTLRSS